MNAFIEVGTKIAREAGAIMLASFGLGTAHHIKPDATPVTEADKKINDLVLTRLHEAFPTHSFIGEEGSETRDSRFVWVFDPIDGTAPYLRGIPTNVFSLGLVEDGEPTAGVVYDPYLNRLYHAGRGEGAYLNDIPIHTSEHTTLARSYIAADGRTAFKDMGFHERLREESVHVLSYGSTVYAQMLVATGQLEGAVYAGTKPWDEAAAKIIIEEAGGVTASIRGDTQRYDASIDGFMSACTPEYHARLQELIRPSLAD